MAPLRRDVDRELRLSSAVMREMRELTLVRDAKRGMTLKIGRDVQRELTLSS